MSDTLPNLINDPTMEVLRELEREHARNIQDLLLKLDIARGARDAIVEAMDRSNKKQKKPRRTIERPMPSTTSGPTDPPEVKSETPAAPSVFTRPAAVEADPEAA